MQNTNYWQNDGKGFYYCPVCHKYSSEDEDGYPDKREYTPTHCPHCGTKVLFPENQDNSSPICDDFSITSNNKDKINVDETVKQAIGYLIDNPCCICSYEGCCQIKYKLTCPVWRELKVKLYINLRQKNKGE